MKKINSWKIYFFHSWIWPTPGLLKIRVYWNKGYDVIIPDYDVTNEILSRDSNSIVDALMWPKFGNSIISLREVITTLVYKDLPRKTAFFEEWCWFKFNNLGLALGANFKFYTSVAKEWKLKVFTWAFFPSLTPLPPFPPPSWMNRVNTFMCLDFLPSKTIFLRE